MNINQGECTASQAGSTKLEYLNGDLMDSMDAADFRATKPYPWFNPLGMIQADKWSQLIAEMPDREMFTPVFGKERKFEQGTMDRYILLYNRSVKLSETWQGFIDELCGSVYRQFVERLFGVRSVRFSFQWHYTPRGASVPPHVDSRRKIGSQIFYMNTSNDWHPGWGGQTLVLNDGGNLRHNSNPDIDSFYHCEKIVINENRSLIFGRSKRSWHAVQALECPEGAMRKVFIVTYERNRPIQRLRKWFAHIVKGQSIKDPNELGVF